MWLIAYLLMLYGVLIPLFGQPEGFLEWLAVIVVSWVVANVFENLVDGS